MTIVEALRESKERFDSGERELAGSDRNRKEVAPSYMRDSGGGGVRWDPDWGYTFRGVELLATDWQRSGFQTVKR